MKAAEMATRRLLTTATPIRLSASQKAFVAGASAVFGLLDTHRGDLIATLTEMTTPPALLESLHQRMLLTDSGRCLLKEKPTVDSSTVKFEVLAGLPANTFGRHYHDFMTSHGYHPEERTPVRFIANPDHAFVIQRYRQTHDFVHCLSGLPTSRFGEICQKWFELLHYGLPMCGLASVAGPLRLSAWEQWQLATRYIPWAVSCSRSTQFLLSIYFEQEFDKDLGDLRRQLGFIKAPPIKNQ